MRIILGMIMVVVGVILIIIPVVPGWPLVIPGLIILATKFKWAQKLLERLRAAGHHFRKPTG